MRLFHAVLLIDHHEAERLRAHSHPTKQRGSVVRTEHELYAEVCDAPLGIQEVLVTGSTTAQADLRHELEKHRPAQVAQVVGYESVDHPSGGQLLAVARRYFLRHDRMAGLPTPS